MGKDKTRIDWKEIDRAGDYTAYEFLDQIQSILEPKLDEYLFNLTEGEWVWIGEERSLNPDTGEEDLDYEATEIPYSDAISSEVILTQYDSKDQTVYERRISEAGKKKLFDLLLSMVTELAKGYGA